MFNINCGDDAQPGPTCGMFDTERPGGDAKGPPDMSLDELLSKLDLSEYKSKFESAGVADVPTLARLTDAAARRRAGVPRKNVPTRVSATGPDERSRP